MAFGFVASPFNTNTALQGASTAAQQAAAQVAKSNGQWVPQVSAQTAPATPPAPALQQQTPAAGQQQSPFGLHLNMPQDGVNMPGYENYMPAQSAAPAAAQSGAGSSFGDFLSSLKSGGGDFMSTLASLFGA